MNLHLWRDMHVVKHIYDVDQSPFGKFDGFEPGLTMLSLVWSSILDFFIFVISGEPPVISDFEIMYLVHIQSSFGLSEVLGGLLPRHLPPVALTSRVHMFLNNMSSYI